MISANVSIEVLGMSDVNSAGCIRIQLAIYWEGSLTDWHPFFPEYIVCSCNMEEEVWKPKQLKVTKPSELG